jgi:CheY-like chemotaxis protein
VLIRMLLADMLGEIGYTVAAEAGTVDEALEAPRKTNFDLAILDANLEGRFRWKSGLAADITSMTEFDRCC